MVQQSESNFFHRFTLYWSIEAVVAKKNNPPQFPLPTPHSLAKASGISRITLGHW
jgi:DNA-binding GntR family transcriptional regulator